MEETRAVKNRMHLDIENANIEHEADRLVGLGATRDSEVTMPGTWLDVDPPSPSFPTS